MRIPNIPPQLAEQIAGLGNTPLVRAAVRYWWVALPFGYAAWAKYQERRKKGEANLHNVLADLAPLAGTLAAIVTINYTLAQQQAQQPQPVAGAAPGSNAKDASFTVNQPVAGIGAPHA